MKLMLCDDHELFLDAIAGVLHSRGHDVAATSDPEQAVDRVASQAPDVCVLESNLADTDGTALAAAIRKRDPRTVIVLLTGEVTTDVWAAYDGGLVDGVVNKSRGIDHLERALVRAANGERVLEGCDRPARTSPAASLVEPLTDREQEVLLLIVDGDSTETMSARLGVSRNTVRTHVQHVLRKLGVHERNKAVRLALDLGLVEPPVAPARAG